MVDGGVLLDGRHPFLRCLGNGKDRRKESNHGGRYGFMMRLAKQLAGIKSDGAAGSQLRKLRFSLASIGVGQLGHASCRGVRIYVESGVWGACAGTA
jgi:hypothetical protein